MVNSSCPSLEPAVMYFVTWPTDGYVAYVVKAFLPFFCLERKKLGISVNFLNIICMGIEFLKVIPVIERKIPFTVGVPSHCKGGQLS